MKTHNYQVPGTRIMEQVIKQKVPDKNLGKNPEGSEFSFMRHINLPENELLEVWYEDSIAPIRSREFHNPSSPVNENKWSNSRQEILFGARPFSEIYNMAVMHDSY